MTGLRGAWRESPGLVSAGAVSLLYAPVLVVSWLGDVASWAWWAALVVYWSAILPGVVHDRAWRRRGGSR